MASLLWAEPSFEIVGQASDGLVAIRMALQIKPTVVLLDLNPQKLAGTEVAHRMGALIPEANKPGVSQDLPAIYSVLGGKPRVHPASRLGSLEEILVLDNHCNPRC